MDYIINGRGRNVDYNCITPLAWVEIHCFALTIKKEFPFRIPPDPSDPWGPHDSWTPTIPNGPQGLQGSRGFPKDPQCALMDPQDH